MFCTLLFCLCGCHLTGVFGESVSVMEGDFAILQTGVTEIQEGDDVLWTYQTGKSLIAQIRRNKQIFPDGRFKDRLKLDRQTGSLTITNITTKLAGVYELKISGAKRSTKPFSVSVYARMPFPVIIRDREEDDEQSSCSVVCSVVNVSAVSLSWYQGNSLFSRISVSNLSISLSLPLEVGYQENNTYSCVINNTISNHTTHLDINTHCRDQDPPLLHIMLISAAVFFLIATSIVICHICWKSRKTDETGTEMEVRSHTPLCETTQKMKKSDTVYENVAKKR